MTNESQNSEYTEQEEKIFRSALRVFAKYGRDGATVQLIADEAGANKALIHYYFRSKDRLYYTVFDFVLTNFFRLTADAITEAQDFKTTLAAFIERYISLLSENPDVIQFIIGEVTRSPEDVHRHMLERLSQFEITPYQAFERKMKEAIAQGEIRDVDPVQTFMTLISSCLMPFIMHPIGRAIIPAFRENPEAVMEQRKQHVFDLIYNGLRS